jgi:hypothetical protein
MLFVQIRIKDDWVAAVEPQPSFAPFFRWDCQVRRLSGGSDGDRFRVFYRPGRACSYSVSGPALESLTCATLAITVCFARKSPKPRPRSPTDARVRGRDPVLGRDQESPLPGCRAWRQP